MKILILLQETQGGTNFLLERFFHWLNSHRYSATLCRPRDLVVGDWDLIILPTSEKHRLLHLAKSKCQARGVIFWSMGHGALRASFYSPTLSSATGIRRVFYWLLKWRAEVAACFLMETKSVFFTDEVGMNADVLGLKHNFNYYGDDLILPIAIKPPPIGNPPPFIINNNNESVLRVGWLGRLDADFKISSLLRVISDVHAQKTANELKCKLVLVVIGDGDSVHMLNAALKSLSYIELIHKKFIPNDELPPFINENIDVMFAMGTSALDSAKLAIPTVIVQPLRILDNSPLAIYRWIDESKGFSLGEFLGENIRPTQVARTMPEILAMFFLNGPKIQASCRNYAEMFFEDRVFKTFLNKTKAAGFVLKVNHFLYEWFFIFKIKNTMKMIARSVKLTKYD